MGKERKVFWVECKVVLNGKPAGRPSQDGAEAAALQVSVARQHGQAAQLQGGAAPSRQVRRGASHEGHRRGAGLVQPAGGRRCARALLAAS